MTAAHRHDGWSPDRTARFLDTLSHRGNVGAATAAIGLSREAAYRRRRRDPLFARGWAAAMLLAREEGGHILADRALDGVEEEVWFRGEVVGTRIRYDNRLLLAHIARLDRLALDETAQADAARFDELVACLAGAEPPLPLAANDDLPPTRDVFMDRAAQGEVDRQEEEAAGGFGEDEWERERREAAERIQQARDDAAKAWDGWQHDACTHVDTLLAAKIRPEPEDADPSTLSTLSTSPAAPDLAPTPTPLVPSLSTDARKTPQPACTSHAIPRQAQDKRDGQKQTQHTSPHPAPPAIPPAARPAHSVLANAPAPLPHFAGMILPGGIGHPPVRPNRHMRRAHRSP